MIDPRTDKGDFADLCRVAAGAMGSDNPALLAILEKDYWVTRALAAIAGSHAENVVFKGRDQPLERLGRDAALQ